MRLSNSQISNFLITNITLSITHTSQLTALFIMTKVETDLFVRALALGGVLGMALQVIDSEVNDPKVATSRIVAAPNLATTEILSTIMEIPVETFQAILTGSLMRESLVPRPVKHTVEQRRRMLAKIYMNFSQSLSATPESEPSTAPSGSIPDESYKIVDMLSSRLTEDEELEYLVKWARSPTGIHCLSSIKELC